eukprot:CFRG6179T1
MWSTIFLFGSRSLPHKNIHSSNLLQRLRNFEMDVKEIIEPLLEFYKDSSRLLRKCSKPDRKEFEKIAAATAVGFVIMGGIGFLVKLIHIPINNIIVGA